MGPGIELRGLGEVLCNGLDLEWVGLIADRL